MILENAGTNFEKSDAPKAHILLHFIRHAEKAADNRIPDEEDMEVRLTDKGRRQAAEKGIDMGGIASRPLAVGGPRKRTQETALWGIAGIDYRLKGNENFEELLATPDEEGIPYGDRMWENRLLDVPFVKGTNIHEVLTTAYDEGRYLRTLVENHKNIKSGLLEEMDVYAIQVGNIARIIQRWVGLTRKFADRVAYHDGKIGDNEREIERLMATHGGVSESFIAEIIRRTRGEAELEAFLRSVPNGIGLAEGFDVEIIGTDGSHEPRLHIRANLGSTDSKYVFDADIPTQVINEIVIEFSTL